MTKKLFAEFFGTFWLVFGGCGSAIFASQIAPSAGGQLGILLIGVSLAFGLTVLTMAYAVGHISGGHFNPAVTLGLVAGKRFKIQDAVPYIISQCLGAIVAAGALFCINDGVVGEGAGAFATNFYEHAVYFGKGYSMQAAFLAEFLLTMFFLIIIMGTTDKFANGKFAGIAIGLALTLIHLISIPITNTSVNPARSLSQAVFVGGEAISQLWLFWVAPILGAVAGGFIYKFLLQKEEN